MIFLLFCITEKIKFFVLILKIFSMRNKSNNEENFYQSRQVRFTPNSSNFSLSASANYRERCSGFF